MGIVFPDVPRLLRYPCARVSRDEEVETTAPSHSSCVGWSLLPPRGCTTLEKGWVCSTCSSVSTWWMFPLPQRRSKEGWCTQCFLSISGQHTLPEAVKPLLVPEGPLHIPMGFCRAAQSCADRVSLNPCFWWLTAAVVTLPSAFSISGHRWSSFQN